LENRKHLARDTISLADICVFSDLYLAFTGLLPAETIQRYPKLSEWWQRLAGTSQFKAVVGEVKLSASSKRNEHAGGDKSGKKDKKEKASSEKEKPAKEEKKSKKKEEEPEEELDAADEALLAEPKEKDPFAALPAGTFNMDEFKREYSNKDTLTEALPYFWNKFDKQNYSIWYGEYKFPQELTKVFMSCNLITGMFQRLDKMRKQAFGSMILFGGDNSSTISGVWIWRGQDLAFELSPDWAVDYESYNWKKLDADTPETKKLVQEYFAWEGDFDGKKFNQGKIFK